MRSAIERSIGSGPFDLLIVKLPHRGGRHEGIECRRRQFAVVIIGALQIDEHVALRLVVTDPLNEAAARRIGASERFQVDAAAVLDVDRFGDRRRGDDEAAPGDRP